MNYLENSYHSICKAIQILSAKAENICIPLKHTFSYDLIVDVQGIVSRIKVIRTDCKSPSGVYVVNIRKSGRAEKNKLPFTPASCEFLFVDCPVGCYLIPTVNITQTRAISLSMFEEFLIKPS